MFAEPLDGDHRAGEGDEPMWVTVLQRRHAEAFLAHVDADRDHLARWLGWARAERMSTVEQAHGFIDRGLTRFAEDGLPWFALWQGERLLGGTLFFPVDSFSGGTEIGYWLASSAGGRGIATAMVRTALRFAFEEVGVPRVGLKAEVGNAASLALATRIGFRPEGIQRAGYLTADGPVDMATYGLLADDWFAER